MSDLAKRLEGLTPAQRQLLEKRLQKASSVAEPIAIIGMSCRFPGAPNLEAFWRLIHDGVDAVSEIPRSRWDIDEFFDPTGEQLGKISVRWGCFVDDVDQFDPQFFGITPREASQMDPQQRLLLEVAWETMENAGLPADQLAGSKTGVYVGIGAVDFAKVLITYDNYFESITAYSGTGNALSIAANRLSYVFDFHGPSLSVDTACSSSSLGIHLAVESLRRGECDAALAGGVNLILTPETTITFSKARMLSPEGKCRPFDASANGYVRGEGCGMVLLKRLSDAIENGDQVLAVLRATAVNQDGRTSGISAPNGQAQQACIRAALKQAGVAPEQITYIEAHGTGTPLGDPIEMQSLGEIFRRKSEADPSLYVTSVKANVGHMETVSGVAGLIKTVLMMEHQEIAPQLHFQQLNPHIKLEGSRLIVPTRHMPWPKSDQPRLAGISSFGFGGTNTHVIVESSPVEIPTKTAAVHDRPMHIVKLSAKTEPALAAQAEQLSAYLAQNVDANLPDVAFSANAGRADFNQRAALVAADRQHLGELLASVAAGKAAPGIKRSTVRTLGRPKVAFLFTGQGAQYVGMGRGLYESHPTFRAALDRSASILDPIWDESLLEILFAVNAVEDPSALVHQTQYTQPALFALEYALAELWRSWGVRPDIVLGHSLGEYVAAVAAGVMSVEDGLQLIAERSRLMQQVTRHGKMAVVFASEQHVAQALRDSASSVTIATINGPENTVISGDGQAVEEAAARFEAAGLGVQMLNVSHAFHSHHMDEILDEFEDFASTIKFHAPEATLISNLTGKAMREAPTAQYWRDHLRNAVRFADGMRHVAEVEPMAVIEIGPSTSLLSAARRCAPELKTAWIPSLRQGQDDWLTLSGSVAEFYVQGGRIDWRAWDKPWPRRRVLLPNYPFERSRQWHELHVDKRRPYGDNISVGVGTGTSSRHPLLGTSLSTVWTNLLLETSLSAQSPAYLADHQVQGSPVLPAAAYVEQGLAAAETLFGPGLHGIENLSIQQAMFFPEGSRRRVQVTIAPESGGESTFETYSRPADDDASAKPWTLHGTGRLVHENRATSKSAGSIDLAAIRARAVSTTTGPDFYQLMAARGLAYGPAFQVLDELVRTPTDALARVALPEFIRKEAQAYHLHPAIGDALLQSMAGAVPLEKDGSYSSYTYMPVAIGRVVVHAPLGNLDQPLFTVAWRTSQDDRPSPESVEGDVALVGDKGELLVAFEGVRVQRVGRGAGASASQGTADWLYRVGWQPLPLEMASSPPADGTWLIFADGQGVAEALASQLAKREQACVLVSAGDAFRIDSKVASNGRAGSGRTATIDPLDESHYRELLKQALADTGNSCLGIIHLWSLDIPSAENSGDDEIWAKARKLGCGSALQLFRALSRHSFAKAPPVWLATAGAQVVEGQTAPVAVQQSALLGLGRVAVLEQPDFRPRLVDLDPTADATGRGKALAEEIWADAAEQQIAYRDAVRYVARLRADADAIQQDSAISGDKLAVPSGKSYQLRITAPGSFDALRFVPVERERPAAGQVEIEVRAAGLNFSDVLKALGLYPGIRDAIVPLGIEASGIVAAVGDGVSQFKIGEEVMGVVPYAFASHARTAEYALVPKPKLIDHEEACTIPITFLTAYYGLVRLAQLQRGERVLIHAAAGGVGLAAIQIAQQIGAEIFATAGSDEKRDFVRSLGVRHVMSSRTLDFADQILEITGREGIDVVLNSLPGEAITKSLSSLRAYGRFLEIGKTDIYMNRMIGLLPFQDNLSYFAIDLDRMLRQRPDYIRELFAEVMRHFESGTYRPLMLTRFEAEETIGAFRYMSQRKNIGKVVVSMAPSDKTAAPSEQPLVRSDGTYLITGGLGALGMRVAAWLAEQGAGAIALLARRSPNADQKKAIASLGTKVVALQGDVTDLASLEGALEKLPADLPPLRGVVHAAGVLADGILADMDLAQLDKAMQPKVEGAWNLHRATGDAPLDFFAMFSSVASVLGSPGQANYAAGNAMLDALAHYRRAKGLPATAINWGPWADAGMAADKGRGAGIESRGMGLIPPEDGLEMFGKLLRSGAAQVSVMDVRWADMLRMMGSRRGSLLAEIAAEYEESTGGSTASRVDHAFRTRLLEADAPTRDSLVQEYIRDELARIMGVEAGQLETDQPLSTFGLDSLLALELKNNLESRLAFTLPMARLMEGPSIKSLAAETARLVVNGEATAGSGASADQGEWSPLLTLRGEGDLTPLVLLPGLAGDVKCYGELVQRLPVGRPVYVFRPRGIDDSQPPHRSMDEMVADYQAALTKIQPQGPYFLAGWSTGGIFAFALAQSLIESGADLGMLALFDTPLPQVFGGIDLDDDSRFFCDMLKFASHFSGTDIRIDYDELATLDPETRFQRTLAEARRQGTISAEAPENYIRRLVHVGKANVRVIQSYEPRPFGQAVALFVPATKGGLSEVAGQTVPEESDLGWGTQIGQTVEIREVPGDHFGMMQGPGAAELAGHLDTLMKATVAGSVR